MRLRRALEKGSTARKGASCHWLQVLAGGGSGQARPLWTPVVPALSRKVRVEYPVPPSAQRRACIDKKRAFLLRAFVRPEFCG